MADTVTVACKIPNGLILRVFNMVEHDEPVMGGGTKTTKRAHQLGQSVTIKGPATPFGQAPKVVTAGGYAINTGIDADFWNAWIEQNKDHEAVKSGLIYSMARQDSASKEAESRASVKSGLEPLDPEKPMKGIQRADKAA
ncbi:hypothetical protein [Allorhizobium ampelinum]|uniref:hypothetical protein n=1 Tax=Allorhizobium ampelinum TaxID=3025782 RepID=UPI000B406076|nr:hypothetical protein [Allorhizobium ampelinum]NTA27404.1 hypothetical protein [Allorhizobium ampelinum]OVE94460.1 hypothetical protein B7W85_12985 [Allorhizobium ampelinum]